MVDLPTEPVVAYLRDSGGARQQLSVPRQEEEVKKWCAANGYSLARVFADVARPGDTTAGRSALFELLAYLENKPKVLGVVVYEYERWSRDFDDSQFYVASIRRGGYQFFSVSNPIPEGAIGKVVESLYFYAAEEERTKLSRRVRSGMSYVVRELKGFPFPDPPVGYRKVTVSIATPSGPRLVNQLEPDPATAPLVRQAYRMRIEGYTLSEIRRHTGLFKHSSGLVAMFKRTIYTGRYLFRGATIEGYCPALVDPATWQKVNEIHEEARKRGGFYHPRRASSSFALSGLARCGVCGGPLSGSHAKDYRYYVCKRTPSVVAASSYCTGQCLRADLLEGRVKQRLVDLFSDPQALRKLQAEVERQSTSKDGERTGRLARAKDELAAVEKGISHDIEAIRLYGSHNLIADLSALEKRHAELRQSIFELEAQAPVQGIKLDLVELGAMLAPALEAAREDQLRRLFRSVVVEVRAQKNGKDVSGEIRYRLGQVEDCLSL